MNISLRHLLFAVVIAAIAADDGFTQDAFPTASPSEVGMKDEALELLGEHVQSLVENDEVVGAELHVIRQGKTIFHQAFGWADRQEQRQLQPNSIYCVRSMTKPLVGTAIQMLIDEGRVSPDQRVSEILPSFDRPATKHITIQHLLTHTSGLPFSTIQKPLQEYASIHDVAAEASQVKLEFEPGTSFQYSDAGSDTLGAVVGTITGGNPEKFIEQRILTPLAMKDSYTLLLTEDGLPTDDGIRGRIPSAYSGGTGDWERHWHRDDEPIFPIFLTSQSLYSTTSDYARFIKLWMDGGAHQGRQLLTPAAIQRGLQPGRRIEDYPQGFPGLELTYGQQWMIYANEDSQATIFGHNGSDGTHVWAWPDEELMVLFFTQTRGTLAGIELEPTLNQLLVKQDVDGYRSDYLARQQARTKFAQYEGLYWDQDAEAACYAIRLVDSQLIMERPGRMRAALKPMAEEGKFMLAGALELNFEGGDPSPAVQMIAGKRSERQVRHMTSPALPSVEAVNDQVRKAYGMQHLAKAGIIKLSGSIKMGPLGLKSRIDQWFDSRNMRTEIKGWTSSTIIIIRGDQVAVSSNGGKTFELQSGVVREQEVLAHPAVHYGDWDEDTTHMEVLKRLKTEEQDLLLLRAEVKQLPGATLFVDTISGLVTAEHSLQYLPGAGYIGVETSYSDFREVAGLTLPFRSESKFANPLIGKVVVEFESFEVDLEAKELFEIGDE